MNGMEGKGRDGIYSNGLVIRKGSLQGNRNEGRRNERERMEGEKD